MAEAQTLQDRIEAIIHLADAGRMEAIGADGLTPSAALLAIEVLAHSIIDDECEEQSEPESGRERRAAKLSRLPKIVPAAGPDHPSEGMIQ